MKLFGIALFSGLGFAQAESLYQATAGTTLQAAIDAAGLKDALEGTEKQTVFTPSDAAFDGLDGASPNTILKHLLTANEYQKGLLRDVILTHVVSGQVLAADLVNGLVKRSRGPGNLTFDTSVNPATVSATNAAQITATDNIVDNGVTHEVNAVLVPMIDASLRSIAEDLAADDDDIFTSLLTQLTTFNLADTFTNPQEGKSWTVFAPTNAAFDELLSALGTKFGGTANIPSQLLNDALLSHVMDGVRAAADVPTDGEAYLSTLGGKIKVSQLALNSTDSFALNGVSHALDTVIVPTLYSLATNNAELETLVAALNTAGLDGTLSGLDNEFTVFAPTDEAFAAVSAVLPYLLADKPYAKALLTELLTFHVVAGSKDAVALTSAGKATTLEGAEVTVADGKVEGIALNSTDTYAGNGIVHVLNGVLIPADFPVQTIPEAVVAKGADYTTIVSALTSNNFVGPLSQAGDIYTVFIPSNEALNTLLTSIGRTLDEVVAAGLLLPILQAHVVAGAAVDAATVSGLTEFETLGGEKIQVADIADSLVETDARALNGLIHYIDAVIVPPTVAAALADNGNSESSASSATVSMFLGLAAMAVFN